MNTESLKARRVINRPSDLVNVTLDYVELTSPGKTLLVMLTGFIGMWLAAKGLPEFSLSFWGLIGIGLASAGSLVFNNYYDRDIDRLMERTHKRALPSGRIEPDRALLLGTFLSIASFIILSAFTNVLSAILAIFTIIFYAYFYTAVLKRRTPGATEIGGIPGALPPVIGWAVVTGQTGFESWLLFLIMLLWQPPHFWALAIRYRDDYSRAGIPTVPVVYSEHHTNFRSIFYVTLLVIVSLLPYYFKMAGRLYLAIASILGAIYLILYCIHILSKRDLNRCLFVYSIVYLTVLFVSMIVDIVR